MAETMHIAAVLGPARLATGADTRAALNLLPSHTQFLFRGAKHACEAASVPLGFPLPVTPCRAAVNGKRAALWLGPDEWLLVAPADQAVPLQAAFVAALEGQPYSLVDVSHRNTAMMLQGKDATLVLNAGCPLDFNQSAFPVGMCTRTILGKATVIIWRLEAQTFHVNTWRSFAPYVWDFMIEARTRL